jgi:isopentenyl diphosphate isomerase/L-lactate dehydrogenase-like FMN-dependent dehydrogenase
MAATTKASDRRAFLRFLAASPLMAYAGLTSDWVQEMLGMPAAAQEKYVIKSVREALNVFDFERAAEQKLNPAHFYFLTYGVFNDETLRANRDGMDRYGVKLRRFTGIAGVDQSVDIFGVKWESPIFLCPVGRLLGYHPEGNIAVARAAKARNTLEILSGAGLRDAVSAARGQPVWVQAGPQPELIKEMEAAGYPALVWTVDGYGGGNQIGGRSVQAVGVADLDRDHDQRCISCHTKPVANRITLDDPMTRLGALGALGGGGTGPSAPSQSWADVRKAKDMTKKMKLVLKGIVTREDAEQSVKSGVDAIIVSNHGAHVDAAGVGAIEALPEVVAGAGGKIPVFVDSGFRSGADIYKALALGATAVGIGRPYVWGLSSFGTEGVETVIVLLRRELQVIMAQTGSSSLAKISRASLIDRGPVHRPQLGTLGR